MKYTCNVHVHTMCTCVTIHVIRGLIWFFDGIGVFCFS